MGLSVYGYVGKEVEVEEVIRRISQVTGSKVDNHTRLIEGEVSGYLHFKCDDFERKMFYCMQEGTVGQFDRIDSKLHVGLMLGKVSGGAKLMQKIVAGFGGYLLVDQVDGEQDVTYVEKVGG